MTDREGYDSLSESGYLFDLDTLLRKDEVRYTLFQPYLTEKNVILEDNAIEYRLSESESYQAVTETVSNGIVFSDFPAAAAGFSTPVYFGIIANTPRLDTCLNYLNYLLTVEY